tara:strand:+ start:36039 stop:36575 length:537 start_codon:yes stop_codon:yes gene_type:complete
MLSYTQNESFSIAEFGGGNSCFHDGVLSSCKVAKYVIYDNNDIGVKKFHEKYKKNKTSSAINCDLLSSDVEEKNEYDIVFSVGLIEHFDEAGTAELIKKHFDAVKPGGIVIITAPTPTILYRVIRCAAECLGVWRFHDERPLFKQEVHYQVEKFGEILNQKLLWAVGLTQYAVVARKN